MAYTRQALPCICVQMENHSVKTAVSLVLLSSNSLQSSARLESWLHGAEHTCLLLQTMEEAMDQTTTVRLSALSCPCPSMSAPLGRSQ